MPIVTTVYKVIHEGLDAKEAVSKLMNRAKKIED